MLFRSQNIAFLISYVLLVFYSCRARSIIYGAHRFILNERDVLLNAGEYETAFLMSIEPMKLPDHPFLAGRSGDSDATTPVDVF